MVITTRGGYYKQVSPVISCLTRNLLVAITLLLATNFSANADAVFNVPGNNCSFDKTDVGGCPTGSLTINNPNGYNYAIGPCGFSNCDALTSVTFNGAIYAIALDGFKNCGALTSVTFNGAVYGIEYGAFYNCGALTSITFTQTTPPDIDDNSHQNKAFGGVPNTCKVFVPFKTTDANLALYTSRLQAAGYIGTIERLPKPPQKTTKIGRINIKQGKVEIKPRE